MFLDSIFTVTPGRTRRLSPPFAIYIARVVEQKRSTKHRAYMP